MSESSTDKDVKAPKVLERAKEEIDAIVQTVKSADNASSNDVQTPNVLDKAKEGIDGIVKTINDKKESLAKSLDDTKDANVFDKAKDGLDAIVQTINAKKEALSQSFDDADAKAVDVLEKAQEGIDTIVSTINTKKDPQTHDSSDQKADAKSGKSSSSSSSENNVKAVGVKEETGDKVKLEQRSADHHKETHGTSDSINENTPIDSVKGPSVLDRTKEEFAAIAETIRGMKESVATPSLPKNEGGFLSCFGGLLEKACSPGNEKRD